jgi:tetratricopeptide (TPR) repeat protein/transcriptional regulator with XRE-family HTH domain
MRESEPLPFGDLLRHHRIAAGLTQEELAERAGLSRRGIADLERGARRAPRRDTVALLAEALALGPADRAIFQAAARQSAPHGLSPLADGVSTPSGVVEQPLPIGGFLGALPDSPLVARAAELDRLGAVVEAVAAGAGRLVLLAGEPGIGKTRLAQEITLAARNRGFVVVTGRCYEPQETVAYYPFLEALTKAYALASAALRAEVPRRWMEVTRLLPDQILVGLTPAPLAPAGHDDQQRLFWQVTGFLQALASERPLALLLDDLHWADCASLDLVQHLARHTREHRILVLGAYRDVDMGRQHPLRAALRDLGREKLAERIVLRRLPADGTAALVTATMGTGDVSLELTALIHERADGNPFFIQELLRAFVERGNVYHDDGRWAWRAADEIVVPENVRSVIDQRLAHLSVPALEILQEASVLGQTFTFDDLRALQDRPEADVEAALDEATHAGMARPAGLDGYAFQHVLIQQALYVELTPRRRRRLHQAAGMALERLPERERERRVAELGRHFVEGGEGERALSYLLRAGVQAEAVYAHREAEQHLLRALALAEELGIREQEAEALEKLGAVLTALARYDAALKALERAAESYQATGDREGNLRAVAQIGRVHAQRGTPQKGVARLQPLLESHAVSEPSAGLASLYVALAETLSGSGQLSESLVAAERAAEIAEAVGDDQTLAEAEWRRSNAIGLLTSIEEGVHVLETRAIPLAQATGNLWIGALSLHLIAIQRLLRGELEEARRSAERALEVAERLGDPTVTAFILGTRGFIAYFIGEWGRARADLEQAVAMVRQVAVSWYSAGALGRFGLLCLGEGRWEAAAAYLEESIALATRIGDPQPVREVHIMLAERDLLEGRAEEARARLEPLLDRPGPGQGEVPILLSLLAWAHLDLGHEEQAQARVAEGAARAQAENNRLAPVEVLRVQALLATRRRRWRKAEAALEEALRLTRAMPYPHAEAKALYVYGLLHVAKGERRQACERFEAALTICRHLGERLYAEHVEQALAQLNSV